MEEQTGSNGRGDAARPGDRSNRRRDAVRRTVADPAEVARLFSALPPAAPEAEMSLLGAMIVDPKVIADVIGIVSQPDDFAKAGHATIFQHMVALYDSTATVEIVSLVQRLKDHGVLEDVGGSAYLMDLAEGVATAATAPVPAVQASAHGPGARRHGWPLSPLCGRPPPVRPWPRPTP